VGPLALGASREAVAGLLDPSAVVERTPDGAGVALVDPIGGLKVELQPGRGAVAVSLLRPEGDSFVGRASAARTVEGLGLHSLPGDFAQHWGPPDEEHPALSPFYEGGRILRYRRRGLALLVAATPGSAPRLMALRVEAPAPSP